MKLEKSAVYNLCPKICLWCVNLHGRIKKNVGYCQKYKKMVILEDETACSDWKFFKGDMIYVPKGRVEKKEEKYRNKYIKERKLFYED